MNILKALIEQKRELLEQLRESNSDEDRSQIRMSISLLDKRIYFEQNKSKTGASRFLKDSDDEDI